MSDRSQPPEACFRGKRPFWIQRKSVERFTPTTRKTSAALILWSSARILGRSDVLLGARRGIGFGRGASRRSRSRWIRSPRDSAIRRCELIEDPEELVAYHAERLRIVSDELWNRVQAVQCACTPRSEAIRAAKRQLGRGPALWLSSLLVCSECGSNYVQYGRSDYVCSGFHNGSTCSNGMRFRIADIEAAVLEALEMDFLNPAALERATDLAMEYFDKLYKVARPLEHASSELLAIAARETEVREQFKAGKLPSAVFKTWLDELAKERRAFSRPAPPPPTQVTRSEFLQAYKAAVARRLDVFTKRDNVAGARLALRNVLADGRLVLRPNAKNARFEGTLTLSHEQFWQEKQVDIKMVAGGLLATNSTAVVRFPNIDRRKIRREKIPTRCGRGTR